MIIFRQFLTKQNKSILSAQYLVLGVQIACGVWWAGGVFWQKKSMFSLHEYIQTKMGKTVNAVNIFVLSFCHHMLILAVFTIILAFLPLMEHLQC